MGFAPVWLMWHLSKRSNASSSTTVLPDPVGEDNTCSLIALSTYCIRISLLHGVENDGRFHRQTHDFNLDLHTFESRTNGDS
jgi:hypothetical protein